ncbi:MAG TPA: glycosyltransferase family 39 protein, partial [Anaerolineae bacterium]|nr:glycosyltransferase family 39 protein [Anaerolineae bacterium]
MNQQLAVRTKFSGREWIVVAAIFLLAFALRTIDLTRVPPGLHNDEVVAAKLTETVVNGRLTIFFPEDTGMEPLPFYIAAPFMKLIGTTVFALRLPAIFESMLALSVIFALGRRLFGKRVAIIASALFAITFWTVLFGRIVLNVTLLPPLATLLAYLFWRAWSSQGKREIVLWLLSGLTLGLALLSYTASRILPAILIVFAVYVLNAHRSDWRRWWKGIAITLIVGAIVSAPMFIYLAGNPSADNLNAFEIDRPLIELKNGNLQPVIETSFNTLGMFAFNGDPLPYYDVPNRPVFDPITALLLAIGLLIALWRWRKAEYAFVFIWFFVSLAPGMLSQPAPNYTRTLGVQAVLFFLPGLAIVALIDRWHAKIIYSALAILFVGNLVWTAHDYFTVWPSIDAVRFWHQSGLYAVANRLQSDLDSSPVAICLPDNLVDERTWWWNPAWRHMQYLLHRPDISVRYYNCADTLILIDGSARYAFPNAIDEATLQQFPIYSQFLARSATDRLELPQRLGTMLRVDRSSTPLAQVLNQISISSTLTLDVDQSSAQVPIDFGDKVQLLGYSLSKSSVKPGHSFDLVTYWKVTNSLSPQLSQFTHMLNGQGDIVAQEDRLMLTSQSLQVGDVFIQIHHLSMPGDLKPGEYQLS